MAIRKNCSRFTDRNNIRRMAAQGYDHDQISSQLSITTGHIEYVLKNWDKDLEKSKDLAKQALADQVIRDRERAKPANAPMSIDDAERARIREQARQELLAEMAAQRETEPVAEEVQEELPLEPEVAVETPEEEPKRRVRKNQAA